MNNTHAADVASARTAGRSHHGIARIAFGVVALGLFVGARPAAAQDATAGNGDWEFRISSGTVIPTGDQRNAIERGDMSAAQIAYVVRPTLALTATLGWARSQDIVADHDRKLDVFSYDIGAEVRSPAWLSAGSLTFSPFAGAGAGARSYTYRRFDADATHNVAGYVSAGGELAVGPVELRLEARNYVTGFNGLDGAGSSGARNDVALIFGLGFER